MFRVAACSPLRQLQGILKNPILVTFSSEMDLELMRYQQMIELLLKTALMFVWRANRLILSETRLIEDKQSLLSDNCLPTLCLREAYIIVAEWLLF